MKEKFARLYVDGKPYGTDKSFPIQQMVKKDLISQGFKKERIQIHYPHLSGVGRCCNCFGLDYKPYLNVYQGSEYWICTKCKKFNYI